MRTRLIIILLTFFGSYTVAQTNLSVNSSVTAQQLAHYLDDPNDCLEILDSTATISSSYWATTSGTFSGGPLGFTNGIILSSGNVNQAIGPNNSSQTSTNYWQTGDTDYDAVHGLPTANGDNSDDCTVLYFKFIPHGPKINLDFIFASEAYYENMSTYPNGIAIFIQGPGFGAWENIALAPSTAGSPVNVTTINTTEPPGTNGAYFVDNLFGTYCEYDGWTVPITAEKDGLTPCQEYEMKIVVADVSNGNWTNDHYDSAIFLRKHSMQGGFGLTLQNYSQSGTQFDISEGCTNQLMIIRGDLSDTTDFFFDISFGGSAVYGTDFTGFAPGTYSIPGNQTLVSFNYEAILDNVADEPDSIDIIISHASLCDTSCICTDTVRIQIIDNWDLDAGIVQNDTGICSMHTNFFQITTYIPADMDPSTVSYEWNTGSGASSITIPPPVGTKTLYTVTITDICNQQVVDSIYITNSDFTDIQIGVIDVPCYNDTTGEVHVNPVNGMAPHTYGWDPSGLGDTLSGDILSLSAGVYEVTVYDSVGCSINETFVIDEPDSIYDAISPFDASCYNDSNGTISYQTFNGIPPFSYEWSTGATTPGLSNLSAGTYTVTATDQHNCQITAEATIGQPDSLYVIADDDLLICEGQTVQIGATAYGGTPNYLYQWSDGSSGPSISITPYVSTIYNVQVFDLQGCKSNVEEIVIDLFPPISLQLTTLEDSICKGESTTIFANIQGGTGGPYEVKFKEGANSVLLPPPYEVWPDKTTLYQIWVDDFCGSQTGYQAVTIHVFDEPEIEIASDIVQGCRPLTINFYDEFYEDGRQYRWDYGDNSNDLLATEPAPEHTYQSPGLYDVSLEVVSPVGCVNEVTVEEMINVYPVPTARFHPEPSIASIINPEVFFNNISDDAFVSTWDYGDGSDISNAVNGKHYYRNQGEYLVTLTVENEQGCIDVTEQKVTVRGEFTFYAPSAINPQSMMEENRYFMAKGVGIDLDNFHLIIYDRWGTKVFETFDMYHPWDGKIFGEEAEKGASFPWVIIYKDLNGEEHRQSGTVTVIN